MGAPLCAGLKMKPVAAAVQAGKTAHEGKQSQKEREPEGHRHPLADGIAQGKDHADAKQENKIAPKRRHRGKGLAITTQLRLKQR